MDYIEREQWIEVCQMFFDAYAKFQIDGTEAHWYGCNYRNIEIAFIDCGYFVKVQLYCPEVLRSLNGYYGKLTKNTEGIVLACVGGREKIFLRYKNSRSRRRVSAAQKDTDREIPTVLRRLLGGGLLERNRRGKSDHQASQQRDRSSLFYQCYVGWIHRR